MTPHSEEARLTSAIRDLGESGGEPDWRAMEDRLLQAFTDHGRRRALDVTVPRHRTRLLRASPYAAAAAVIVLAAAITFYPPPTRRGTVAPPTAPAPAPKSGPPVITEPSPRHPTAPVAPTRPRQRAPRLDARRVPHERHPAAAPLAARNNASDTRFDDFVALPAAFALPDFESGRIVRIEVPLTMLPAYGIAMVPDATPESVPADFLIGQDGVPRAIRLASRSQR